MKKSKKSNIIKKEYPDKTGKKQGDS